MTATVTYTVVNGMILSENRGGVETEFVPDTLGSVWQTRDMNGNVTSTTEYWPYGEIQSQTGTNPSKFGYVGLLGYVTDMVNFLYVRARFYRPALTRWQTVDPLWPEELAFGYSGQAPSFNTDVTGMQSAPAIPLPPSGISAGAWEAIIDFLAALGIGLAEIIAILGAIILIALLIGILCADWKKHRYDVCPSEGRKDVLLSGCRGGELCLVTLIKRDAWLACLAIQAFITVICFGGNVSHNRALQSYLGAYLKCMKVIPLNCHGEVCGIPF